MMIGRSLPWVRRACGVRRHRSGLRHCFRQRRRLLRRSHGPPAPVREVQRVLVRLELDGEKVVREERLLKGLVGRIRDVRMGPDGLVYLLTDDAEGALLRLEPVQP